MKVNDNENGCMSYFRSGKLLMYCLFVLHVFQCAWPNLPSISSPKTYFVSAEKVYTVKGVVETSNDPHASSAFNCSKLLTPIFSKRKACQAQSSTQVDICTVFAEDYQYMIPFLIHHLSLGFTKIHIYNNDMKTTWFLHPTLLCLSVADLITIVPWPGDHEFLNGLNNCHRARVLESRSLTYGKDMNQKQLWMGIFDIDELLVLHQDQCISSLVDKYPDTAQLAFNWAMYVPVYPFSAYATFGHPSHMTQEHRNFIDYDRSNPSSALSSSSSGSSNETLPLVILPHDMLLARMKENFHVKCIARPNCVEGVTSPHYMDIFKQCPFPHHTQTLAGKGFLPAPTSAAAEKHVSSYPIAQLNHYWSTSVEDFMRKVHRGRGIKKAGVYRNSGDLPPRSRGPMVKDTVFHTLYGAYFIALKQACPECFDISSILNMPSPAV